MFTCNYLFGSDFLFCALLLHEKIEHKLNKLKKKMFFIWQLATIMAIKISNNMAMTVPPSGATKMGNTKGGHHYVRKEGGGEQI